MTGKKLWLNKNGKVLVNKDGKPYYSEECCCKNACWQKYFCTCSIVNGRTVWSTPELQEVQCGEEAPNGLPNLWVPVEGGAEIWAENTETKCGTEECRQPFDIDPPDFSCNCQVVCEDGYDYNAYMESQDNIGLPMATGMFWSSEGELLWSGPVFLPELSWYRNKYAPDAFAYSISLDGYVDGTPPVPVRRIPINLYVKPAAQILGSLKCCTPSTCKVLHHFNIIATMWEADGYRYTEITGLSAGDVLPPLGNGHYAVFTGEYGQCDVYALPQLETTTDRICREGAIYYSCVPLCFSEVDRNLYTHETAGVFTELKGVNVLDEHSEVALLQKYAYSMDPTKTYTYVVNIAESAVYRAVYSWMPEYESYNIVWEYVGPAEISYSPIRPTELKMCEAAFNAQQWGSLNVGRVTASEFATVVAYRIPQGAVCTVDELPITMTTMVNEDEQTLDGSPLWKYEFYLVPTNTFSGSLLLWGMYLIQDKPLAYAHIFATLCLQYNLLLVTEAWFACEKESPRPLPFDDPSGAGLTQPEECSPVQYVTVVASFDEEFPEPYFADGLVDENNAARTYWLHENDENISPSDEPPVIPALRRYVANTDAYAYMAIRLDINNYPTWCEEELCANVLAPGTYDVPQIDFTVNAWMYAHCGTPPADLKTYAEWPTGHAMRPATHMEDIKPSEFMDCYIGPADWGEVKHIEHIGGGYMDDWCNRPHPRAVGGDTGERRNIFYGNLCPPPSSMDYAILWECWPPHGGGLMDVTEYMDGRQYDCPDMCNKLGLSMSWKDKASCLVTSGDTSAWHELDLEYGYWEKLQVGPPRSCLFPIPFDDTTPCQFPEICLTWDGYALVNDSCTMVPRDRGSMTHAFWRLPNWLPNVCDDPIDIGDPNGNVRGSRELKEVLVYDNWYPMDSTRICSNWPPWSGGEANKSAYFQCGEHAQACIPAPVRSRANISAGMTVEYHDTCVIDYYKEDIRDATAAGYVNTMYSAARRSFTVDNTYVIAGSKMDQYIQMNPGECFGGGIGANPGEIGNNPYNFTSCAWQSNINVSSIYTEDFLTMDYLPNTVDPLPMTVESRFTTKSIVCAPTSFVCTNTGSADWGVVLQGFPDYCCPGSCGSLRLMACDAPGDAGNIYPYRGGCGTAYSQHVSYYTTSTFDPSVDPSYTHYDYVYGPTSYYQSDAQATEHPFDDASADAYFGGWHFIPWGDFCGQDIAGHKFFNKAKYGYESTQAGSSTLFTAQGYQSWNVSTRVVSLVSAIYWPGPTTSIVGSEVFDIQHTGWWSCTQSLKFHFPDYTPPGQDSPLGPGE